MDGTPINQAYLKEEEFDDQILPILEGRERNQGQKEVVVKEKVIEKEPRKGVSEIFEDYYGFFVSSILAALIGYSIFASQMMINFYGNFFSGFYEGESTVVSTKGMIIQLVLVASLHFIGVYWLL